MQSSFAIDVISELRMVTVFLNGTGALLMGNYIKQRAAWDENMPFSKSTDNKLLSEIVAA